MQAASDTLPTIAVFDFDGTLITGDSLWAFFAFIAGWPRVISVLAKATLLFPFRPRRDSFRTFLKEQLLQRLVAGKRVKELAPVIEKLRHWMTWNEAIRRKLLEHRAQGHRIVIATGALDLYMPALLADVPHDALLSTKAEVKDGVVTGAMPEGNCVRLRKAALVAAYLKANGPFGNSFGYGNAPPDLQMLALLKHRVVV
jgi:HAD superfamily phosphoserine phosphatase-like hydrolase